VTATYFEDIAVGERFEAGEYLMTRDEIVEFATRFDPRPFHLEEAAAEQSIFGGLVASGIHTFAAWNNLRLRSERGLHMLAGLGFDKLRYAAPVRPGDRLSLVGECFEKTPSATKPDRGVMRFRHELVNQHGETVMTVEVTLLVARRPG
jgi:acyl dehydratase